MISKLFAPAANSCTFNNDQLDALAQTSELAYTPPIRGLDNFQPILKAIRNLESLGVQNLSIEGTHLAVDGKTLSPVVIVKIINPLEKGRGKDVPVMIIGTNTVRNDEITAIEVLSGIATDHNDNAVLLKNLQRSNGVNATMYHVDYVHQSITAFMSRHASNHKLPEPTHP